MVRSTRRLNVPSTSENRPAMSALNDVLDRARQALSARQPGQAERLARQAIDQAANQPIGWEVLADALRQQGKLPEALAACQQALRHAPDSVEMHQRCAQAWRDCGQPAESLLLLRQALRLRPDHAETLVQLGVQLAEGEQLGEALEHMGRAVQLHPGHPQARHNLGVALAQAGRPEEAAAQLQEAWRLQPGYAEAGYNLGNVLGGLGRKDEAIAAYRRALQLRPDHYGVLNNLGLLLQECRKPGEAVILLRQATRLRPEVPEGHNNLGLALADLGRFDEAERSYHEALRLNPRYAEAHSNLGCALKEMGRVEEALASFELAMCLDPQSRSTRYNRSLCLLQAADWLRGWPEYEFRWGRKGAPERRFSKPRWDGSPLAGKTVLVYTEQGLGDTIQFVRFVMALKRLGGRTVLECPGYLVPLMTRCAGIDVLVAEGQALPEYDVQVPLMSLPGLLGVTLTAGPWGRMVAPASERMPHEVPYLSVEEELVQKWRERLRGDGRFRVGVVWQGNPYYQWDHWRSVPLRHFQALAEVDGVELVSLQHTHGLEQLDQVEGRFAVRRLGEEVNQDGPFVGLAAAMKALDLVVSADTAVGHLAGALG